MVVIFKKLLTICINKYHLFKKHNMPVDKFGHTDSGSMQRVVAGGVTLTQVNNTFLGLDGTNALTGNLNLGGKSIEGLSTDVYSIRR